MTTFQIIDRPMECCGLVMAGGWQGSVDTGKKSRWGTANEFRTPGHEDFKKRFEALIQHQDFFGRNCAMITLSEEQGGIKAMAEEQGFKTVFEFFNPNSSNQVYIMVRTNYDSREEFNEAYPDDDDNW